MVGKGAIYEEEMEDLVLNVDDAEMDTIHMMQESDIFGAIDKRGIFEMKNRREGRPEMADSDREEVDQIGVENSPGPDWKGEGRGPVVALWGESLQKQDGGPQLQKRADGHYDGNYK